MADRSKTTSLLDFICDLAADEHKRQQFKANPHAVVEASNLSDAHKDALKSGAAEDIAKHIGREVFDESCW